MATLYPASTHLFAFVLALMFVTTPARAQYIWIDERGTKQFSDMPPPASVPSNRILKQPGSTFAGQPDPAATASNPKQDTTAAEKNAEFRKRRAELAAKQTKEEEEARFTAEKRRHCQLTKDYQRSLSSGERIARTDKNGERTFLTDEQRAQELKDANKTLADCK